MKGRYSIFLVLLVISSVVAVSYSSGCMGGSSGEKNWLELVPSNAVLAVNINPKVTTEESFIRALKEAGIYNEYIDDVNTLKEKTGVDINSLKRAIFVMESSDEENSALYAEGKFDVSRIEQAIEKENETSLKRGTYKGVEMYYSEDAKAALALTSDYVIVGRRAIVEDMIDLIKGNGQWAKKFSDIGKKLGRGDVVAVVDYSYFYGSVSENTEENPDIGSLVSASSAVDYIGLKIDFVSSGYGIELLLHAKDISSAKEIKNDINASLTLAGSWAKRMQNANVSSVVATLMKSIKVSRDGQYVSIKLTLSEDLLESLKGTMERRTVEW